MEANTENQLSKRSEEVQEIIGVVPSVIIRWGITVIVLMLVSILLVSWFIKYPDILISKVVITTTPAPITFVSRGNGTLILLKQENNHIKKGDLIAYLKSNANPEAVIALEKLILTNNNKSGFHSGSIGDLETTYSRLLNQELALRNFQELKLYDNKISQLKKQESTYKRLNSSLQVQNKLLAKELFLEGEKHKVDSILFIQNVTSSMDFNQSKTNWLQQLRSSGASETNILNNELQQNQLSLQIAELELQKFEKYQNLKLEVENTRKELLANISKWKDNFLFIAPQSGKLAFLGFLEDEKFIEAGKPVISLVPESGKIIAHAELPLKGSGKVKKGQHVNIQLDNYPYEQYGNVRGIVTDISPIPVEGKYFVTIQLPYGLKTNLINNLPLKHEMAGTTEIITDDLRLIERFIYGFRKLVNAR